MKTRVIAAAVLLPLLLIAVLFLPKIVTAVIFGALAAIAAYELLYRTDLVKEVRLVAYSAVIAFGVSLWSLYGKQYTWAMIGILVFFAALFGEMMASHVKISFEKVAYCLAAGLLLPYLLTSIVRIHSWPLGRRYVFIPFILAFLSDTGAYFAGRAFGKHKLAPVISPHKTVEGVVGGVLGATLGMLIEDGRLDNFVKERYVSYQSGIGKKIVDRTSTLQELAAYAEKLGKPELPASGKQECLESIVNQVLFG